MKKEVSTNQLIIISIIAIALSLFSILLSVTKLDVTSASSSGEGYINVTVMEITDITIWISSINFSATTPGQSRNSYNASDVQDCDKDNHCGFNITNDGSCFLNITIQETENLFGSSNFNATQHFTYNVTMKDPLYATAYGSKGNCSTGYDQGFKGPDDGGQTGQWRAIPRTSAEVAICYLNNTDEPSDGNPEHRPDIAVVELNITAPIDEATGSKTGSLTFSAAEA